MKNLFDRKPEAPEGLAVFGKDQCVLCGQETAYSATTPISQREFYVEGAGQLCRGCFRKLYAGKH